MVDTCEAEKLRDDIDTKYSSIAAIVDPACMAAMLGGVTAYSNTSLILFDMDVSTYSIMFIVGTIILTVLHFVILREAYCAAALNVNKNNSFTYSLVSKLSAAALWLGRISRYCGYGSLFIILLFYTVGVTK